MATKVNAIESDRGRSMSAEDDMMFMMGSPFGDYPNTHSTPTTTPHNTPAKTTPAEKEILRPISMPKPFKI
ncbi:hypothetical protein ACHAXH_004121 [Discostella pseudostelligera]